MQHLRLLSQSFQIAGILSRKRWVDCRLRTPPGAPTVKRTSNKRKLGETSSFSGLLQTTNYRDWIYSSLPWFGPQPTWEISLCQCLFSLLRDVLHPKYCQSSYGLRPDFRHVKSCPPMGNSQFWGKNESKGSNKNKRAQNNEPIPPCTCGTSVFWDVQTPYLVAHPT